MPPTPAGSSLFEPSTHIESAIPRLEHPLDVDYQSLVWAGAPSYSPPDALMLPIRFPSGWGVLDGRYGASELVIRDSNGHHVVHHGVPFRVEGTALQIAPSPSDPTGHARLWPTSGPCPLPAGPFVRSVQRTLAAVTDSPSASPSKTLVVAFRQIQSNGRVSIHCNLPSGDVLFMEEIASSGVGQGVMEFGSQNQNIVSTGKGEGVLTFMPTLPESILVFWATQTTWTGRIFMGIQT